MKRPTEAQVRHAGQLKQKLAMIYELRNSIIAGVDEAIEEADGDLKALDEVQAILRTADQRLWP